MDWPGWCRGGRDEEAALAALRTYGPRGGRERDKILAHVLDAERGYLKRIAGKLKHGAGADPCNEMLPTRQVILAALDATMAYGLTAQGPHGGAIWPRRYFVQREAWHVTDHIGKSKSEAYDPYHGRLVKGEIMDNDHWIDRTEYPFTSHYMEAPAGKLHYVDEGQGEPIVMVHGNPTWSFLYRHLITRLRGTHRCVAPDHLGFGLSDKPQDWGYLPHDHAANITALIETLDLHDVTLVVQDWGGPIGLCYAVNQPDNVARLVIINTWAWPVNQDPYYVAFSGFVGGPVGRTLIRRRNFFATSIMRQAFGDKAKLRPEAHAHYLQPLADPADRKGCYVFPRQIVAATPWLEQLWAQVPVLREKPVLIVWGMKDIAFREKELKQWEATFPHAEVVRLETVGHYVQEEAPDALGQALDAFLAQTTAGTNR